MSRLTDNDKRFGLITYGKTDWKALRFVWSSGGGEDDEGSGNDLTIYACGWVARIGLPKILRPYKEKHMAESWSEETKARLGRDYYFVLFPRDYGFSLSDGFFQIYHGARTHDSATDKTWSCFLPWTQKRHVRHSLYGLDGGLFFEIGEEPKAWLSMYDKKKECPSASFEFNDYDGKRIVAATRIEEREWLHGTGWFKWLCWFVKPLVRRSLDIEFSEEVGPEKGSWKGGTIGTGIDMLQGELHESAFKRYCEEEHSSKSRRYQIEFVGACA